MFYLCRNMSNWFDCILRIMCHSLKYDLLLACVIIIVIKYIIITLVNGKKMHYSVGHRYKGQTEVATFWCCLVFQQLHMQFWSKRASSCICWTQQRRRRRTVVEKRRKKDQIWKKYFKILKDIDHYNSWLLMLVMVLHEKILCTVNQNAFFLAKISQKNFWKF